MNEPRIAGKSPTAVPVEKGQTYYWCSCGLSPNQPFCSGAHKGSAFRPAAFTAKESTTLYFCTCKKTGTPPLCDGSHKKLP